MLQKFSATSLPKDKFGIPVLPADRVNEENGLLNAQVHLFTNIEPSKETYTIIRIFNVPVTNVLPDFYYIKPDTQGKDPRKKENIKFIDEEETGKIRQGYVLLGLAPYKNCGIENLWGMRNHLHQPINPNNLGIICAINDKYSWSVRNYFEEKNVKGLSREILSSLAIQNHA